MWIINSINAPALYEADFLSEIQDSFGPLIDVLHMNVDGVFTIRDGNTKFFSLVRPLCILGIKSEERIALIPVRVRSSFGSAPIYHD